MPEWETAITHFEDHWQAGHKPDIAQFFKADDDLTHSARRDLVIELVKVDLEYRWKAARSQGRKSALRLEAYARRLPILGSPAQLPLHLIAEEYRVRRRFGDGPGLHEYVARFTHARSDITAALEDVDRELVAERLALASPAKRTPRRHRSPIDPQAPLLFGDYILQRQIGSGGICRVYGGVQLSLAKEVAIKVLRRRFWNSAEVVDHFFQEAQVVAHLRLPGIVRTHGVGTLPGGGYFMAMDLVDGQDLHSRRKVGEPPLCHVIKWIAATAEIVDLVHARGYVHGDLKPANILLEHSGGVLLTDFGFAGPLENSVYQLPIRAVGGTPAFVPPELMREAETKPERAMDVFGLGGALFYLLTGRAVHEQPMTAARSATLSEGEWKAYVSTRLPGTIPRLLEETCCACLALDPLARPNVAELIRRLETLGATKNPPAAEAAGGF